MNTTPKTDACIKMLGEAQLVFAPLFYNGKGHFDKDHIFDFQNRIIAMFDYRLFPFGVITIPDDADKETARANPILQNISNFDAFWYAMKHYQLITADDLKNEFWSICPDLESINSFLDVMNIKFDGVNCNYETDINVITERYSGLNEHVEAGIISKDEAYTVFWNISFIAERYNFRMDCIRDIYKTFRQMVQPQQSDTSTHAATQKLAIPDNILQKSQQAGFIENITACPMNWTGTIKELNYFINKYFPNVPAKWKKTVNTFVWNGTAISENSLKTAIDKYDTPPERAEIIDNLS
jgi:hypothetical protein